MWGFYHLFIEDFSKIIKPLTQLSAKAALFVFTDECYEAFCGIDFCPHRLTA